MNEFQSQNANPFAFGEMGLAQIKAAIPHIEPQYQPMLAAIVKLIELQRIMSICGDEMNAARAGMSGKREMLSLFRAFLPEEKQPMIDTLITMMG